MFYLIVGHTKIKKLLLTKSSIVKLLYTILHPTVLTVQYSFLTFQKALSIVFLSMTNWQEHLEAKKKKALSPLIKVKALLFSI